MQLRDRWPLAEGSEVRAALMEAYADPARGYHDALHLSEVLDRLDELSSAGVLFDDEPVRLAAWFHDAVYDGQPGAEERSAQWAASALAGLVSAPVVVEVARLVRLTEEHAPTEDDVDGCALSDADLAILAASPERYAAYVAGVRRDYAWVSDDDFRAGRAAVLRDLAGRAHLFHTAYGREAWEPPARANLAAELAALT
jgi:predicted metal-dependent HD superfamily phosphohydrolase